MSFNVSDLTAYVDQNKLALIKKAVLGGRTINYIKVQPGIKSSAAINIINSDLVAQSGSCGWNADGTTILSQQDLSVTPLKVNESLCLTTLEEYWTQTLMNPGSYNTQLPFEQIFVEEKADKVSAMVDDILWKGNTASGSGNLALCDGIIRLCDVTFSGSVVDGNTANVTAITPSNIIAIVDGMAASVPTDIINMDDLVLFCGYDFYRTYSTALRNANYFAYNGAENQGQDFSQMVPGTNIRIVAVRGLNGTNKLVLSSSSVIYYGTDLLGDQENFELFYSADFDEVRFRVKFKMGVQFAFPEFVVYFKLN
jgi:hypothetical protein